ncbi:MAG: Crp/Fnr family transcriptional regulator [Gammaproteobacteria bacterium]|nr:Crp/Fnr family transcriptional regulator [Gammaproteobacteria bacterium]
MKDIQIKNAWTGVENCNNCAIRNQVLFSDLQKDDFDHIHKPIEEIQYGPGITIYEQDEIVENVYTIRSGLVKLIQSLPDGKSRIVRILGQGDLLGIESLHQQYTQHYAITLENVDVCRIPHSVISSLQHNSTRLHASLLSRWQETINIADLWITQLSTGKIKYRVARILLFLDEKTIGHHFFMPTREDIGAMLGITTESVSKVTAEFKRKQWLTISKDNQAEINATELKKLCNNSN